LRKEIILKTK